MSFDYERAEEICSGEWVSGSEMRELVAMFTDNVREVLSTMGVAKGVRCKVCKRPTPGGRYPSEPRTICDSAECRRENNRQAAEARWEARRNIAPTFDARLAELRRELGYDAPTNVSTREERA